jgi:hypothetical protein
MDKRILAIHQAIVDKILDQPVLLEAAKETLEQRYKTGLMSYANYINWQSIIELIHQPDAFANAVLSNEQWMSNMRRTTIFSGILNEEERSQILTAFVK